MTRRADGLLDRATCPHCWEVFAPEDVLWIAEHADLLGDPRLGPDHHQRFLPSRFTPEGDALDACGRTCQRLACPRCHLDLPRGLLELEPTFMSILGAPGSGKSYYLTSLCWQLRKTLPTVFGLAFADADPSSNRALNTCEEALFLHPEPEALTPLGRLIPKTELQGELYDVVTYGQQSVTYLRPWLFAVRNAEGRGRMLCLYDNAGEHFQPGRDTTDAPVTRHLARASALLYLFDPTQDPRFAAAAGVGGRDRDRFGGGRQETILQEAAARVRRLTRLPQTARHSRPLLVVLTKSDTWSSLLGTEDDSTGQSEPWHKPGGAPAAGLDVERIELRSRSLRMLLQRHCPEVVSAAEGFAEHVTYLACSALGPAVVADRKTGVPSIRPSAIHPEGVMVPLLYAMAVSGSGLVSRLKRKAVEAPGEARR